MATPISCHGSPVRPRSCRRAMTISTGRKRITSRIGWTSSIRGSSRCHSASRRTGPGPAAVIRLDHVASPSTASALIVSSSTSRRATSLSSPTISSAPAADAVVTVTVASPNSRAMRALDVVDGLDPRHRRDPALAGPPAGLGVDRGVGDLPAVDQVAPARHHGDVRRQRPGRQSDPRPPRHVEQVDDRPDAARRDADGQRPRACDQGLAVHISRARGLTRWLGSRREGVRTARVVSP